GCIRQYNRHLQEHPEKVADIVGTVFGKTFRAVAALQQESLAVGDPRQLLLQIPRLAGKNQRRECRQLVFDVGQTLPVRIIRYLLNWPFAPAVGRPTFSHYALLQYLGGLIHEAAPNWPVFLKNSVI